MKELVCHSPGMGAWEDKARPVIQDPGDAIVRIATSRRGSKASWAHSSFPFSEILPLQNCVMSVTSIGDADHGGSTSFQATMQIIEV
jgi:hypothetical protein